MPEHHVPGGACASFCVACPPKPVAVVINVLGVTLCGDHYSRWTHAVELFKRAELARLLEAPR